MDPGVVNTNIMREVPPCLSNLAFVVLRLFCLLQSPEVGVSSILHAALAPPVSFSDSTYAACLCDVNAIDGLSCPSQPYKRFYAKHLINYPLTNL